MHNAPRFPQRRTLGAALLCLLASGLNTALAQDKPKAIQQRDNSASLTLNLLCNARFVSGRQTDDVIRDDFHVFPGAQAIWKSAELTVDAPQGRMTVRLPATASAPGFEQTSVYTAGYGCTLLPAGVAKVSAPAVPTSPPQRAAPLEKAELSAEQQKAVDAALDFAFQEPADWRLGTRGVVVLQNGRLVAERYSPGITADTRLGSWSMAKSITATLLGLYTKTQPLDLNAPAPIPAWQQAGDPRAKIRTIDLLQMASGLTFPRPTQEGKGLLTDMDYQSSVYFKPQDTEKLAQSPELKDPPGTRFDYKNSDPLVLGSVMRRGLTAQGVDYLAWPKRALFDPVGAHTAVMNIDAWGNFLSSGMVFATVQDFARVGQLWLNDGRWGQAQLLPAGWVGKMTAPSPASAGYGGLVWLNTQGAYPNVPRDAYAFVGAFGQRVMVVPSRGLVVARLGSSDRAFDVPAAQTATGEPQDFPSHFDRVVTRLLAALP